MNQKERNVFIKRMGSISGFDVLQEARTDDELAAVVRGHIKWLKDHTDEAINIISNEAREGIPNYE
ncbi:MAG: hypothetical protein IMZ64_12965 [Bacteroidetes bacterium]|nr:hypothetical protein [Bacteroidota bacterium]